VARVLPEVSDCDPPTIISLIRSAIDRDVDRVALVQLSNKRRNRGIIILLIGSKAIREVAPMLLSHSQNSNTPHKSILNILPSQSALHIFEWLREEKRGTATATFRLFGETISLSGFLGNDVCAKLEFELKRLGVKMGVD